MNPYCSRALYKGPDETQDGRRKVLRESLEYQSPRPRRLSFRRRTRFAGAPPNLTLSRAGTAIWTTK